MTTDLRPPIDWPFVDFGLAAVVTPKAGAPISTTVIWPAPEPISAADVSLGASDAAILAGHPTVHVRRDEVPSLPEGSTIEGPQVAGGPSRVWVVDQVDRRDPEVWRATVR